MQWGLHLVIYTVVQWGLHLFIDYWIRDVVCPRYPSDPIAKYILNSDFGAIFEKGSFCLFAAQGNIYFTPERAWLSPPAVATRMLNVAGRGLLLDVLDVVPSPFPARKSQMLN